MVHHAKMEAALRISRNNIYTVFEKFEDFIFVVDADGEIVTCNQCRLVKLGYSNSESIPTSINRILPGALALIDEQNNEHSETYDHVKHEIHQGNLLDKNNRLVPVEIRISVGSWDDEDVWYIVCRDVKDRLAMERERDRLGKAIEQITESIVITKADGLIIYTNPAFCKLTGYSKDEVLGSNPRILKSGNQDEAFYKQLWETINRGVTWSGRFENCKKDGRAWILRLRPA